MISLVAQRQLDAGDILELTARSTSVGDGRRARLAELIGLRLSAPLGYRLREVGEQHGEPEPSGDEPGEDVLLRGGAREVLYEVERHERTAQLDDEHDRVANHSPRIELGDALLPRTEQDRRVAERAWLPRH
jgi:hypothetical protein